MAKSRISEAYVQLVPSMDGFGKSIQRALNNDAALKNPLGNNFDKNAETSGRKAGGSLAKGLKIGLGAAAIGLAAGTAIVGGIAGKLASKALSGGLDRALNIEDAQAKLRGLGYQSEEISSITTNVLDAVRGTAYSLDQTMGVAATALAAGVNQGDDLTSYLKLVTDTATITGAEVNEIGSIFNKVQAMGKVYTGELNQLQDRGLPVFSWLQEEYGVTAEALQDMVSKGEVSSERLFAAVQKNIGGAALASGDTVRGSIANFNAALSRLGASAVSGALPVIQQILQKAIPVIDTLTERLKPLAEQFWTTFGPQAIAGAEKFFNFILSLTDGSMNLEGGLGGLFTALEPLTEIISVLSPLRMIFATLLQMGPQIATALAPIGTVIMETLVPAFGQIFEALAPVITALLETVAIVIQALVPVFIELLNILVPIITMLVEWFAPILVMIAEILGVILPPIIEIFGEIFKNVFVTLAMAIYTIMLVITGIINAFLDVANSWGANLTLLPAPQPPNLPALATGGDIRASKGGTAVITGEGGEDETVTNLGGTNQLIDNSNALAAMALNGGGTGGETNVYITLNQKESQSAQEMVDAIDDYFTFNSLKPARYGE